MRKTLSLIVIMLIILVALTGCVQVNYEVSINKDGSAEIAYVYGFNKEFLEQQGASADEMTEDMKKNAQNSEYEIESYSDDTISGFKATKHLEKASDFSLQEAFGNGYITDSEENKIKVESQNEKTTYSQNADIDLTSMSQMAEYVTMKYTIKLPVKVGENNASEVSKDGKILTWNLKAGESTNVKFEAVNAGIMPLILKCAALVLLIVIAIVIIKTFLNNKKSKNIVEVKKEDKKEEIEKKTKTPKKKITKEDETKQSKKSKKEN